MVGVGAILFTAIIWEADPVILWEKVTAFGVGVVYFVLAEGVGDIFHTWGTGRCFSRDQRKIPFFNLLMIRNVGMSYNYITPTSGFGGDVVKGVLIERYVGRSEAASVIIIDKLTFGITQFGMAFFGSAVVLFWIDIPLGAKIGFWIASVLMLAGFIGFLFFQRAGWFGPFMQRIAGIFAGQRARDWVAKNLAEVDARLHAYYRKQGFDLILSMFWHGAAFAMGIVQAWLFLHFVFEADDWSKACAIWFLGTWFDVIVFMVPSGLGTQELSRALVFKSIEFQWNEGVAFSMIMRFNDIVWATTGFLCYAIELAQKRPAKEPQP